MKKFGNKIVKILSTDLGTLSINLKFSDGFSGVVSLKHLFGRPKGLSAEILKGGGFRRCFVESGALAWPNGFELCPDAIRQWIHEQRQGKNKAA